MPVRAERVAQVVGTKHAERAGADGRLRRIRKEARETAQLTIANGEDCIR